MQLVFNGSIQICSDESNINFQKELERWIVEKGWGLTNLMTTELPSETIAPIQVGIGTAIFHPEYNVNLSANGTQKRFYLSRVWDTTLPVLTIFMMSPSTADEMTGDLTVDFVTSFAKRHHFGSVNVVTISPIIRGSDIRQDYLDIDDDQWDIINFAIHNSDIVVLGWGEKGQRLGIPLLIENYPLQELLKQNLEKLRVFDFGRSNYCSLYPKHPRPKLIHQRFSIDHQLKTVSAEQLLELIPTLVPQD